MKKDKSAIQYEEGQQMLFNSTYRGLPFIIGSSSLLALYLYYNLGNKLFISIWLACIVFLAFSRMIYCKIVLRDNLLQTSPIYHLRMFYYLTLLSGLIWSSIYFLAIPYTTQQEQHTIILILGGVSAASTTNLSVYFSLFLAYVMTVFSPIILYNYSFLEINHAILATTFALFVFSLLIIAKTNQKLLKNIFYLTEQVEILSITDELTGLYNRRHFTKMMHDIYIRAKTTKQSFALISIDIDNFKLINDNFGHTFGDKFIVYTAKYLNNNLKKSNDIIFRMGGDEFAVIVMNISEDRIKSVCEELRAEFIKSARADYEKYNSNHPNVINKVSISLGVVYVPHDSSSKIEQIIETADQILYQSKNEGKNQISFVKCD